MINGIYYPKRATQMMKLARPGITRKDFEQGYMETDKLVNTIVGLGNEVARLALADAIYAVEKSDFYFFNVAKWTRKTFEEQESYEHRHLHKFFKDQQQVFLDYLDAVEEEFRPHIFKMNMSLRLAMLRQKQSNAILKAQVECGRVIAKLACDNFDALMEAHRKKYGVNYAAHFQEFRYTKPLALWTRVTRLIVTDDHPEDNNSLTDDKNCQLAYEVLARKMCDFKLINRIGYVAISKNREIAEKYATMEELQELQDQYGERQEIAEQNPK